jgi:hypothetical protein
VREKAFPCSLRLYFALIPHWLKPILELCKSDANKTLLVQSPSLLPLLLTALFLEADHPRKEDVDQALQAAIQTDAADCFLQIAVFGPGRELLSADGGAMGALHALAEGHAALTPEAKLSAAGAVLAIEGRTHEPQQPEMMAAQHGGASGRHVMVSYQWEVQVTIERLVRSLQARGYLVWFDVDMMKGSTVRCRHAAQRLPPHSTAVPIPTCCLLLCDSMQYTDASHDVWPSSSLEV